MTTMAIITPSFRPDFDRFRRLHQSVLRYTDGEVMHHVIVPGIDAGMFRAIDSNRLTVWSYQDVMPTGLMATDRLAALTRRIPLIPSSFNCAAICRRRPWKPVRGWVLQQLIKMHIAHHIDSDILVYADSDVIFVRDVHVDDLVRDGAVRFYSVDDGISRTRKRAYLWSEIAHELLGIDWEGNESYPDHIAGLVTWDRKLLCQCLARVESTTGKPWAVAVTRYLHFSEYILYGTYVRNFGSAHERSFQRDTTLCLSHWSPTPMSLSETTDFVAGFTEGDLAVHVQSKSDTEDEVVRSIVDHLERADLG